MQQLKTIGSNFEHQELISQTLAEVQVLQLRGKLPHAVECTALFASLRLADVPGANIFVLRNSYALAIVRFVNGILDPFQQGQYASALVNIAKTVGLPLSFVEIRHAATHDELPTLEMLRVVAAEAQEWLKENYWEQLSLESGQIGRFGRGWSSELGPTDSSQIAGSAAETGEVIVRCLKIYKRSRKRQLDSEVLVRVEMDSDQKIFWSAVDTLVSLCKYKSTQVAEILVKQFLVKKVEAKTKTAIKIYMPLVEHLGCGFRWKVALALIQQCSPLLPDHFDGCSLVQADQWLQLLIPLVLQGPFPGSSDDLKKEWFEHRIENRDEAIIVLRTNLSLLDSDSSVRKSVEEALDGLVRKKFALPPLLEEILSKQSSGEPEEGEKKGIERKRQRTTRVFETSDNWTVKPFGVA